MIKPQTTAMERTRAATTTDSSVHLPSEETLLSLRATSTPIKGAYFLAPFQRQASLPETTLKSVSKSSVGLATSSHLTSSSLLPSQNLSSPILRSSHCHLPHHPSSKPSSSDHGPSKHDLSHYAFSKPPPSHHEFSKLPSELTATSQRGHYRGVVAHHAMRVGDVFHTTDLLIEDLLKRSEEDDDEEEEDEDFSADESDARSSRYIPVSYGLKFY